LSKYNLTVTLSEARLEWEAGKAHDGYFSGADLLKQVEKVIDIFESRTNNTATKNPELGWTHVKNGPNMRTTTLPDGSVQDLYFPANHETFPGWFKGMEQIVRERGLWPVGARNILAQCKDFKCKEGVTNCCCR
jgi:hypothetical protein